MKAKQQMRATKKKFQNFILYNLIQTKTDQIDVYLT